MRRRMSKQVLLTLSVLFCLVWACPLSAQAGVVVSDPSLPPVAGWYEGDPLSQVADYTTAQATEIRMSNFRNISRTIEGADERLDFDVTLTATVNPGIPVSFDGPLVVLVFGKAGLTTGTFTADIISANCTGSIGPITGIIRENPTLASTGQIEITDIGGGNYNIDSFFDIFTELSLDGGAFSPDANAPHHMVLVPEPATLMLLVAGAAALIRRRRI